MVNFQKHNAAMLIKHLDKFYNHRQIPWVELVWSEYYQGNVPHLESLVGSLWWRDVLKQVDYFRGVSQTELGNGTLFAFWSDKWVLEGSAQTLM